MLNSHDKARKLDYLKQSALEKTEEPEPKSKERTMSVSNLTVVLDPFKLASIYRVSQEVCARLRESVPYVKIYRYNPKHLYPKFNGYGDIGQRSLKH